MTTGIIIGVAIGIFIPAPYDKLARDTIGAAWNWVKGFFATTT